jgi:hypothetical protein
MRGNFFGEGSPLGFIFALPGGIEKCVSLDTLRGLFSDGELDMLVSYFLNGHQSLQS